MHIYTKQQCDDGSKKGGKLTCNERKGDKILISHKCSVNAMRMINQLAKNTATTTTTKSRQRPNKANNCKNLHVDVAACVDVASSVAVEELKIFHSARLENPKLAGTACAQNPK